MPKSAALLLDEAVRKLFPTSEAAFLCCREAKAAASGRGVAAVKLLELQLRDLPEGFATAGYRRALEDVLNLLRVDPARAASDPSWVDLYVAERADAGDL